MPRWARSSRDRPSRAWRDQARLVARAARGAGPRQGPRPSRGCKRRRWSCCRAASAVPISRNWRPGGRPCFRRGRDASGLVSAGALLFGMGAPLAWRRSTDAIIWRSRRGSMPRGSAATGVSRLLEPARSCHAEPCACRVPASAATDRARPRWRARDLAGAASLSRKPTPARALDLAASSADRAA